MPGRRAPAASLALFVTAAVLPPQIFLEHTGLVAALDLFSFRGLHKGSYVSSFISSDQHASPETLDTPRGPEDKETTSSLLSKLSRRGGTGAGAPRRGGFSSYLKVPDAYAEDEEPRCFPFTPIWITPKLLQNEIWARQDALLKLLPTAPIVRESYTDTTTLARIHPSWKDPCPLKTDRRHCTLMEAYVKCVWDADAEKCFKREDVAAPRAGRVPLPVRKTAAASKNHTALCSEQRDGESCDKTVENEIRGDARGRGKGEGRRRIQTICVWETEKKICKKGGYQVTSVYKDGCAAISLNLCGDPTLRNDRLGPCKKVTSQVGGEQKEKCVDKYNEEDNVVDNKLNITSTDQSGAEKEGEQAESRRTCAMESPDRIGCLAAAVERQPGRLPRSCRWDEAKQMCVNGPLLKSRKGHCGDVALKDCGDPLVRDREGRPCAKVKHENDTEYSCTTAAAARGHAQLGMIADLRDLSVVNAKPKAGEEVDEDVENGGEGEEEDSSRRAKNDKNKIPAGGVDTCAALRVDVEGGDDFCLDKALTTNSPRGQHHDALRGVHSFSSTCRMVVVEGGAPSSQLQHMEEKWNNTRSTGEGEQAGEVLSTHGRAKYKCQMNSCEAVEFQGADEGACDQVVVFEKLRPVWGAQDEKSRWRKRGVPEFCEPVPENKKKCRTFDPHFSATKYCEHVPLSVCKASYLSPPNSNEHLFRYHANEKTPPILFTCRQNDAGNKCEPFSEVTSLSFVLEMKSHISTIREVPDCFKIDTVEKCDAAPGCVMHWDEPFVCIFSPFHTCADVPRWLNGQSMGGRMRTAEERDRYCNSNTKLLDGSLKRCAIRPEDGLCVEAKDVSNYRVDCVAHTFQASCEQSQRHGYCVWEDDTKNCRKSRCNDWKNKETCDRRINYDEKKGCEWTSFEDYEACDEGAEIITVVACCTGQDRDSCGRKTRSRSGSRCRFDDTDQKCVAELADDQCGEESSMTNVASSPRVLGGKDDEKEPESIVHALIDRCAEIPHHEACDKDPSCKFMLPRSSKAIGLSAGGVDGTSRFERCMALTCGLIGTLLLLVCFSVYYCYCRNRLYYSSSARSARNHASNASARTAMGEHQGGAPANEKQSDAGSTMAGAAGAVPAAHTAASGAGDENDEEQKGEVEQKPTDGDSGSAAPAVEAKQQQEAAEKMDFRSAMGEHQGGAPANEKQSDAGSTMAGAAGAVPAAHTAPSGAGDENDEEQKGEVEQKPTDGDSGSAAPAVEAKQQQEAAEKIDFSHLDLP